MSCTTNPLVEFITQERSCDCVILPTTHEKLLELLLDSKTWLFFDFKNQHKKI